MTRGLLWQEDYYKQQSPCNAMGTSTAEVNTHCILKGKLRNHTYLQQILFMFRKNLIERRLSLPHVTQNSLLLREDNSLEHILNRFWKVEPIEQSSMIAEQKACEKHFLSHRTRRQYGWFVVSLPTKMEPNHNWIFSPLQSELHATELNRERQPDLKFQYQNFMMKYKGLDHRDLVNSQDGKEYTSAISIPQGNKYHRKNSDCISWKCQAF